MKKMTRLICLAMAAIMLFAAVGCSKKTDEVTEPVAGAVTYTETVQGHNGEMTVEVVIEGNVIQSVEVKEHKESPTISDLAISQIPEDIVTYQSINVDTISGATVTSNAVIAAVEAALTEAGLDIADFSVKPEGTAKEEDIEKTADVIVIGAGGAGLAAAVSAHQNGASVIVIEKMPSVGGNTVISGSAYNAADPKRQEAQGIEDSTDLHFEQTYEGGDKKGNTELIRVLVDNAEPGIEWLESLGMEFNDTVFTVLGGLWPRAHKPVKPLGTGYMDAYMGYIEANNIELLLETTAAEIVTENGVVTGVIATGKTGNTVTLHANNGVVLATGGFGASVELRDKYNESWPTLTNVKTTNHAGATGDGLILAEEAGANLINLEDIQLLPMGDPETGSLSGNIEQGVENRIFVNKSGNRFVDEGERRDVMTKALLEQEDNYMWVIVDKHSYENDDVKNNFNESIASLVSAGRAYKADTIEELAAQIDVDPVNLKNTIDKFNESVDAKGQDEFGRTLYQDKIDTAPFYAGARVPTVHHTMGGVEINTDAQALDSAGNVIKGLYAAGEVTGGIHGTNRLGGNALADITVFGKIAGESAAAGK